MKNIRILWIASALVFGGCSKAIEEEVPKTPITLAAAVAFTKAPVVDGENMTISVVGWEVASNLVPAYTTQNWQSTSQVRASENAQTAKLDPVQYYHQQSDYKTFIKATFPQGVMNDKGVLTFVEPEKLKSGKVDVMIAGAIVGSKNDTDIKNLEFRHLLSQIKFQITAVPGSYSTKMTLQSLKIKDARLASGIDFTSDTVVPFAAENLAVGENINKAFVINTESAVGDPVMITPFAGNKFVAIARVDLLANDGRVTSLEIPNINIVLDRDQAFQAGKVYTITLKRSSEYYLEVSMVKVTDWIDINGGRVPIPV